MKRLMMALLLVALPMAASAQDAAKVDAGHYKVLVDNAAVRVLRISYGPGEKSPMHSHPDAVLVPLSSAKARFDMPDGKSQDIDVTDEVAMYTPAMTHAPVNTGAGRIEGILVEIKPKTGAPAAMPAARPGMAIKVLAEGPGALVYRSTLAPDFHEPAGSTHEFDQVVVSLGGDVVLTLEGQPSIVHWKRGDVHFIGHGTKHEAKNAAGKPVDVIIVALK